jgi:peroxiredoxin
MAMLKTGDTASGFTLEGIDGQRHALAGASEPTVLAFFKNSCPTCQLTFPFLQRLVERLQGAPLRVWGISQDDAEKTRAFAQEWGIDFPLLPDEPGYPVSNAFGITNVPTLYLVEPDGRIAWSSLGFVKSDLEALAAELRRRLRVPGVVPLFVQADGVPELKPG